MLLGVVRLWGPADAGAVLLPGGESSTTIMTTEAALQALMEPAWRLGRNRSVWSETGMRRCNAASSPIDGGSSPVDTTNDRDGWATASAAAVGCRFAGGHPQKHEFSRKIAKIKNRRFADILGNRFDLDPSKYFTNF